MSQELTKENRQLLQAIQALIEEAKGTLRQRVNSTMTLLYWNIGKSVNQEILNDERAAYGKEVVATLAKELTVIYGKGYTEKNLRRMIQFYELFPDFEIVATASRQLSWSHFVLLLPIKKPEARLFYAKKIGEELWSVRHARKQIERKVFERSSIADSQLPDVVSTDKATFKDPYFLDFLGLKEGYLEEDLEAAILKDLELFILELGMGFTFVERQKRMIIDGEDFYLDLLFYHRKLRRLVAIDLKIGRFKASYKGQMELYLKWLNKHDRQEGEEMPIGLILCAEASREQVELLEMHKDGIMVAEYWTELPPKEKLEERLHLALVEAKERLAIKKLK